MGGDGGRVVWRVVEVEHCCVRCVGVVHVCVGVWCVRVMDHESESERCNWVLYGRGCLYAGAWLLLCGHGVQGTFGWCDD
jgi:hypothetical protein